MSKILVPIDFLEASINAIAYAVGISKITGSQVVLFHAQALPTVPILEPGLQTADIRTQIELTKNSQERLQKLATQYECECYTNSLDLLELSTEIQPGSIVESINLIIQNDEDYDLIVMGTEGTSGVWNEWIGTHASHVIEGTDIPVLVIPKEAKYNGIYSIALATNTIDLNQQSIQDLLEFSKFFQADLNLVNVEKVKSDQTEYIDIQFSAKVGREPSHDINYTKIKHQDIESALLDYVEDKAIDLLAVVRQKRSLVEAIFHQSLSKKLVMHSHTPVLVMRES